LQADVEVIILPYAVGPDGSLPDRFIRELQSGEWTSFRTAVAFAKSDGNHGPLLDALYEFARGGNTIELTFGADRFSGETPGTEYDAIKIIVEKLDALPTAKIFLYHERKRTFHPKIYLFANESTQHALLFVGSSNWTPGGLFTNIEANVAVHLDLSTDAHRACYETVRGCFEQYWQGSPP
jgi:HKD family nuclease